MSDFYTTAKGLYTPGTVFKSPQSGNEFKVGTEPVFVQQGDHILISRAAKPDDPQNKYDSSPYVYYNGKWGEIIKQETKVKKTQKISRGNLQKIYKVVCPDWQSAIRSKLIFSDEGLFSNEIEVDEEDIKRGLAEANQSQLDVILRYFTKPEGPKKISGFYISSSSSIMEATDVEKQEINTNIFATETQAKAALSYAQLTQLMKEVNGDWEPDWSDEKAKSFSITRRGIDIVVRTSYVMYSPFTFEERSTAEKFLDDNKELIKTYFEL